MATAALLVIAIASTKPPGEPPGLGNLYGGLIQRIDVGIFLLWQIVVAGRLRD